MKKRSLSYILMLVGIGIVVGMFITIALLFLSSSGGRPPIYKLAIPCVSISILLSLLVLKTYIWSSQCKKHEATFSEIGLIPDNIFYSNNCAFYFDLSNCKIAVTTISNPFKLQIVHITEIEKAWISTKEDKMLGFCFMIDKTTFKVPTFSKVDIDYLVLSNSVGEGIAKAETKAQQMVEYILVTKNSVK